MPFLFVVGDKIECDLVIFDLDGTLIDEIPRFRCLAQSRVSALRGLVDESAIESWARASGVNLETWDVDEDGPLVRAPRHDDLIVAATSLYVSGYTWVEANELAQRAYTEADELHAQEYSPVLFDGVGEALKSLREAGLRLALATNDRRAAAERVLRDTGVLGLFDSVVGADDVENPKPSPDMILSVCETCGCPPSRAVYVGDQPTDMKAGSAAGVKAVIAVSPSTGASPELLALADFIVESVRIFRTT